MMEKTTAVDLCDETCVQSLARHETKWPWNYLRFVESSGSTSGSLVKSSELRRNRCDVNDADLLIGQAVVVCSGTLPDQNSSKRSKFVGNSDNCFLSPYDQERPVTSSSCDGGMLPYLRSSKRYNFFGNPGGYRSSHPDQERPVGAGFYNGAISLQSG